MLEFIGSGPSESQRGLELVWLALSRKQLADPLLGLSLERGMHFVRWCEQNMPVRRKTLVW
jgi:hypothetical protein